MIGKGIVERSPEVVRLIERDQFLVQVTLPPGVVLAEPPGAALAQAPIAECQYRSPLRLASNPNRHSDSGIQLLLRGFGRQWLAAWMNTIVYVPSGKTYEGVFLEDTAIVQWQGRSWVYLRAGPDTFKRHPISTDQPVSDDDYVVQRYPAGIRDRNSGRAGSIVRKRRRASFGAAATMIDGVRPTRDGAPGRAGLLRHSLPRDRACARLYGRRLRLVCTGECQVRRVPGIRAAPGRRSRPKRPA